MRRINSEFKTENISEEGHRLRNRDYFGYVEMDDYACYVLADSLDEEPNINTAKIVVESVIRRFTSYPSMRKRRIRRYLREAHRELLRDKRGLSLKASVVVVVTDYRRIFYAYAGNARFYLIRSGRIVERSMDQSLALNLTESELLRLDEVASHEARNNLYSYLGERGNPKISISKKRKLENGDIFTLLSRGVWELCSDEALLKITDDASTVAEVLNQVEDGILKVQESRKIDNYTLAVTFVDRVYESPKKKWTLKRILMILIPVLTIFLVLGIALYMRHRSIENKKQSLGAYMQSGETYLKSDNYVKAAEEYGEALELAQSLKYEKEMNESDSYKKLAEQIILSDEAFSNEEYQRAQTLYQNARELSIENGNVGKDYIDSQLKTVNDHMEVYDLIAIGENREENGNLEGAIEAYKEAKTKAGSIYFSKGKEEALSKQMVAESKLDSEREKEKQEQKEIEDAAVAELAKEQKEAENQQELENKQKSNDYENAIELENKGNELVAEGSYESAITFYQAAKAIYESLEMMELSENLNIKISAANAGIAVEEEKERLAREEAEREEAERESREREAIENASRSEESETEEVLVSEPSDEIIQ